MKKKKNTTILEQGFADQGKPQTNLRLTKAVQRISENRAEETEIESRKRKKMDDEYQAEKKSKQTNKEKKESNAKKAKLEAQISLHYHQSE